MRRIALTLAEDATDITCGSCPQIGEPRGHWCSIWGAMPIGRKRFAECRAAEAALSRSLEIDPSTAAAAIAVYDAMRADAGATHELPEWAPIVAALREHARKAGR